MAKTTTGIKVTVAVCGSLALLAWVIIANLESKSHQLRADDPKKKEIVERFYFGKSICGGQCHALENPLVDKKLAPLCTCMEFNIWEKEDKHGQAYQVLKGDRAKQMGKLLGYDVLTDSRCLTCHGVYFPLNDKKIQRDSSFNIEEGVNCVICHGAAKEWVKEHHGNRIEADRKSWRKWTRADKEKKFGMTDLWDPEKRTALCASCHIGNSKQGKIVTHEMYAAGHPPLPSFEIASFSKEMPNHWKYIKDKDKDIRATLKFDPVQIEFEQTQLVLIGGLVAMREKMKLIAAQAEKGPDTKTSTGGWPEFAQFDCYACHHDLKKKNWRQQRGFVGRPGRPQMHQWHLILAELSLSLIADDKEFPKKLLPLYKAFDAQPFGNAKDIHSTANDVAKWADQMISKIKTAKLTRTNTLALLRLLCKLPQRTLPDYDSARQIAWAFRVIYQELYEDTKKKPAKDKEIQELLTAIAKDLKLKLPSGKKTKIEDHLPDWLKIISNYDPNPFKKKMAELGRLLPAQTK